ncbi:MAG: cysteine desulfurase CsdA [Bdellovibrio sp.]|nr:MAG: cysteine desulfurase CsdA [Bdellovibrio sp.]
MTIEQSKWRSDFPLLAKKVRGKPIVYLDSAATALKPWPVIERVGHFLSYETANVHRGAHFLADQATQAYEAARAKVAKFLGASQPSQIVFTRGTTESMNLVAQSWGLANLKTGDEILLTEMEHHSVIVPWQLVAEKTGAKLVVVDISESGELSLNEIREKMSSRTRVAAITHCSNALGTINDIKGIANIVHSAGAILCVDGAQAVTCRPVSVTDLHADFYAFSGHKLFAPYGIGVLYGRSELLEAMPPYQGGGSMISEVRFEKTSFHDVPYRFEAGTPNIEGVLGLAAAIEYLERQSWDEVMDHEEHLRRYLEEGVRAIGGFRIHGEAAQKSPLVSLTLDGAHASDVGEILDQENIAVRCGHHCAQPLMRKLGVPATVRASLSIYNQKSDADAFLHGLIKAQEMLL